MKTALLCYLTAANLLGFLLMGFDKRAARRRRRRVPERRFFLLAALGGSAGCLLGMYVIRHKTLHRRFSFGIPALLAGQLLLCIWLAFS